MAAALRDPLLKIFPAALLGRLVTIPYYPLSNETLAAITRLQLDRIATRIEQNYKVPFTYTDDVVTMIIDRCKEVESGGRMVDAIVTNTILPEIATEFLHKLMDGVPVGPVTVDVDNGELTYGF